MKGTDRAWLAGVFEMRGTLQVSRHTKEYAEGYSWRRFGDKRYLCRNGHQAAHPKIVFQCSAAKIAHRDATLRRVSGLLAGRGHFGMRVRKVDHRSLGGTASEFVITGWRDAETFRRLIWPYLTEEAKQYWLRFFSTRFEPEEEGIHERSNKAA
jgi:hypothetical protein